MNNKLPYYTEMVTLVVTPEMKKDLNKYSKIMNMNRSEFIREAIERYEAHLSKEWQKG